VLGPYNVYDSDPSLKRALSAISGSSPDDQNAAAVAGLHDFGASCGSELMMHHSETAEKNRPALRQYDRQGRRIDVIDYNPSYHALMAHSLENGAAGYGYMHEGKGKHSHVNRAARIYIANQLEAGHCCPVVMTAAAIPALRGMEGYDEWASKLTMNTYDFRDVPISEKEGITAGMSMTEKQGGSDVRSNTTIASPVDARDTGNGRAYALTGHKWFTSAPMCDGFLTLAYTEGAKAPSCFLVPRWLPDGTRNKGFQVVRLKDKLGDRTNASSEVEYRGAWSTMIGEEGRGVKVIIEMVGSTRLDCALGSAGGSRRAVQLAISHSMQRRAFGEQLINQPLMANLLTDLSVESESHTMASIAMAELWDKRAAGDINPEEGAALRVGVAVAKYYITKRSPGIAYECMEAFGGNGFVEDFPMARLYRHSPLNSIWEGSGNVICLDILRAAAELTPLISYMKAGCAGADTVLDAYIHALEKDVIWTQKALLASKGSDPACQASARNLADRLGIALCASSLVRYQSPLAPLYISSRLGQAVMGGSGQALNACGGFNYGSFIFPQNVCADIIAESAPKI